jgi:saccharopine dehydrogenase-like NADP-dependent oxidoreductase
MATVALVGATGNVGQVLTPILAKSDYIKAIHSLSRRNLKFSDSKVKNFVVDYKKPETLETALKGCDVLINMMGTEGDFEQSKHALVDAAAAAGIKFYIPR